MITDGERSVLKEAGLRVNSKAADRALAEMRIAAKQLGEEPQAAEPEPVFESAASPLQATVVFEGSAVDVEIEDEECSEDM